MATQEALFDAGEERTYGVGELAGRVTKAITSAFPAEVWVKGEIDGWRGAGRNGHVYFNLCERNNRRGPASTLSVAVFRSDYERVQRHLSEWPDLRLDNGIEVRVRGRVQFSYGRLQLVVTAVDPLHTLGGLAVARDRVMRKLADDKLLDTNGLVPVPEAPLDLSVVTSVGSAAHADVIHELQAAGLGFRVRVFDAQVQGSGAEASIIRALRGATLAHPDLVLLVRGGGARTDLAAFDGERLARAIAAMRVAVWTGIGHEVDTSVADAVAHTSFKTPTAAAGAVVERVRVAERRVELAWRSVAVLAAQAADVADTRLDAGATRLKAGGVLALSRSKLAVGSCATRIERAATTHLARCETALGASTARLGRGAGVAVARSDERMGVLAARSHALDPRRALARGWSITRNAEGSLVRSPTDARPGQVLVTQLGEGQVTSTVSEARP